MDGILPLWKPKGFTSHDCVMKIRKLYQTKKVGHTGTLDPEVEGVLPICIGQATKIVPFLTDTSKTYEAEVTLGTATDTEDSHGVVIEQANTTDSPDQKIVSDVLSSFLGVTTQIPPMYSAVKVNGRKLYEYARMGIEVDRPSRNIWIDEIELLSIHKNPESGEPAFSFKVTCSKGTYIRTLAVDIGKALGFPAHMSALVRIRTGEFYKRDCVTFEDIEKGSYPEERQALLEPINKGVSHLDVYEVTNEQKSKVLTGQKMPFPALLPKTDPFRIEHCRQLLAIYQIHPTKKNQIKPVRVFSK